MNDYEIILSSAVISAVVSVILSAVTTYWLKGLEFRNEYYKEIIKKRIEAYIPIEQVIASLKGAALDTEDNKPYHLIFGYGEEGFYNFFSYVKIGIQNSLWIEEKTIEYLEKINAISFKAMLLSSEDPTNIDLIQFGKKYYNELALLRKDLEVSARKDLLTLHDFTKIKKKKKPGVNKIEYQ